jgi:hypothetical protein
LSTTRELWRRSYRATLQRSPNLRKSSKLWRRTSCISWWMLHFLIGFHRRDSSIHLSSRRGRPFSLSPHVCKSEWKPPRRLLSQLCFSSRMCCFSCSLDTKHKKESKLCFRRLVICCPWSMYILLMELWEQKLPDLLTVLRPDPSPWFPALPFSKLTHSFILPTLRKKGIKTKNRNTAQKPKTIRSSKTKKQCSKRVQ